MENLKERLALEAALLERIGSDRDTPGCEEVAAGLEREIIERELAEIERASTPEPAYVLRRQQRRNR